MESFYCIHIASTWGWNLASLLVSNDEMINQYSKNNVWSILMDCYKYFLPINHFVVYNTSYFCRCDLHWDESPVSISIPAKQQIGYDILIPFCPSQFWIGCKKKYSQLTFDNLEGRENNTNMNLISPTLQQKFKAKYARIEWWW